MSTQICLFFIIFSKIQLVNHLPEHLVGCLCCGIALYSCILHYGQSVYRARFRGAKSVCPYYTHNILCCSVLSGGVWDGRFCRNAFTINSHMCFARNVFVNIFVVPPSFWSRPQGPKPKPPLGKKQILPLLCAFCFCFWYARVGCGALSRANEFACNDMYDNMRTLLLCSITSFGNGSCTSSRSQRNFHHIMCVYKHSPANDDDSTVDASTHFRYLLCWCCCRCM